MEYKLTEKENFLRMLSGEMPEFVPHYNMMGWGLRSSVRFSKGPEIGGGFVSDYGVEFTPVSAAGGAALPTPGKFILKEIEDWPNVIHNPTIPNDIDWEAAAKKDTENFDRVNKPCFMSAGDYFQNLMAFMGFTEGLCAMYESPEEVTALFSYLHEYNIAREKIYLHYYKPDIWYILDDNATRMNPFISPEMNRELLIPFQREQAELALDAGCKVMMHDCGRCEDFIPDWIDMGVSAWDPAQVDNDLLGIKAKYKGRLSLLGCWDSQGPASWADSSDELLLDSLAEYVDTYAPGGGFAWTANVLGAEGDENVKRKNELVQKFYEDYAKPWYYNHAS